MKLSFLAIGRALEVNNVPVFNRQSCNTVDDPMVRGFVYDQNICIGDTALTDLCGVSEKEIIEGLE